jgi:hypothetical protein
MSQKKIFGYVLFSLPKVAIWKGCGKGHDFKKENRNWEVFFCLQKQ